MANYLAMLFGKISIVGVLLLSLSSFAQTGGAKPKPTPKPVASSAISQMNLVQAKAFAEAEVLRLKKEIKVAATNPDLLPCDFFTLETQLAYNEWFLKPEHYQQFEQLNTSVDSAIAAINAKLASLENETVNVLVYQGQDTQSSEVPVAFKDLVEFFKLYDQRMKKCPKDQQAAMIDMMETRPMANPFNMVFSQVRTAGGMMSVNLNASLQEQEATYSLVMSPKECGYNLELKVDAELNGVKESYRFSLLDGDPSSQKVELGEKAKWAMLSKGKIDGMPVDGLLRYRKFQDQFKGKCTSLVKIPSARYGFPYIKYADVSKIAQEMEKQGYLVVADPEFVSIKPGTFQMGSPAGEANRNSNENQHSVTLTKAFEIQTTEVTQAQWFEVMKNNPSYFKDKSYCPETWENGMCPYNPLEYISWSDAHKFIETLNEKNDGYLYRLPTEAEWEYAARGGTATAYYSGDTEESLKQVAWFDQNSSGHTHEVAMAGSNSYGLYDMHGNVREWVQDWYGSFGNSAVTDPTGSASGSSHVLRGGGYDNRSKYARSAVREYSNGSNYNIGLRLVRTPR